MSAPSPWRRLAVAFWSMAEAAELAAVGFRAITETFERMAAEHAARSRARWRHRGQSPT